MVRAQPDRLRAYGLSPDDVVLALSAGNVISPSGNLHLGDLYPVVPTNALIKNLQDFGSIPLRQGPHGAVYLRDIGTVEDATDLTTGYALVNGRRAVYILATKRAEASTMSVIDEIKSALPKMQQELPEDIRVSFEFDQSPYVTRAVKSLFNEGALGALLTGLMVLIFLRDVRSALVVVVNIPLAIMAAVVGLWIGGHTINLMTLGGFALAVGILVDEATGSKSRTFTRSYSRSTDLHCAGGLRARQALDRRPPSADHALHARRVCTVVLHGGAARSFFVPLSLAVGFSMISSYILSSTFVPVMSVWLLRHIGHKGHCGNKNVLLCSTDWERLVRRTCRRLVAARWLVVGAYLAAPSAIITIGLGTQLGLETFPHCGVNREFRLRFRALDGTHFSHDRESTPWGCWMPSASTSGPRTSRYHVGIRRHNSL